LGCRLPGLGIRDRRMVGLGQDLLVSPTLLAAHRPLADEAVAVDLVHGNRRSAAIVAGGEHAVADDADAQDLGIVTERPEDPICPVELRDLHDTLVPCVVRIRSGADIEPDERVRRRRRCLGRPLLSLTHRRGEQDPDCPKC